MAETENFFKAYSKTMAYSVEDLKNCENEALASCGAIQSSGYFIAADEHTFRIEAISENLVELLGLKAEAVLGYSLDKILKAKDGSTLDLSTLRSLQHDRSPSVTAKNAEDVAIEFNMSFNHYSDSIGIDLELILPKPAINSHQLLHALISRLESSSDLETDCQFTAETIRQISGFDRVMTYRFQDNWDGEVLAEDKAETLGSFLHLRYPAYDIPQQARDLFLKTNYRMIVDAHNTPIPVLVRAGHDRSETQLGLSLHRASSPIHIQYLHNMGVRSSFSIPIKVHNRLWGLISCHHYQSPLHLPHETRTLTELITRILAGRIASHIERRRLITKQNALEFTQSFVNYLTSGMATKESFLACQDQLLGLLHATGVYIRIQGDEVQLGDCPSREIIDQIVDKAQVATSFGIWKSDCLREALGLDETAEAAAGALVVPFSFGFEDVVIWFRKEAVREVHWGGEPLKSTTAKGRLEPRASFAEWIERLHDRSSAWSEENEESAQFLLFHFIKGIFSKAAALSQANKELERVTRAKDEFIGMVSHELRTPLSAIIGWLDILRESVPMSNPEIKEAIDVIDRNAKLQVNLVNDLLDISRIISGKLRLQLKPFVSIKALIRDVFDSLKPTAQSKNINISLICREDFEVTADADRLRQIVWNLVTNAIKFTPIAGRVTIRAEMENDHYILSVQDNGVGLEPSNLRAIFDRFSQVDGGIASRGGLGLGLSIVKSLVELHGGRIEASSEGLGKGALFAAHLPIFVVTVEEKRQEDSGVKPASVFAPPILKGCRVLLAEDQIDTAMALKFLLERMGAECVHRMDGRTALSELMNSPFQLIISDVGMPDLNGYEFMRAWRLAEKGMGQTVTPAIALTAYATSKDRTMSLESGFQSHIPKPVDKGELIAVIESLGLRKSK